MTSPVLARPPASRGRADRCPGVLRPHHAADGALVRLRVPGGRIAAESLGRLALLADRYGDGRVTLTSRANLQVRGIAVDADGEVDDGLVQAVQAAGLLPAPAAERIRNVVCSPLTGLRGGRADLRPVLADLDTLLCTTPELVDLPGRFLFALDDGRGDMALLGGDVGFRAIDGEWAELVVGDRSSGQVVPLRHAAAALVALARRFLALRDYAWHVRELPGGGAELLDAVSPAEVPGASPAERRASLPAADVAAAPIGVLASDDGSRLLSALVPLGSLNAAMMAAVHDAALVGGGSVVVTPWRGVVIPGLPTDQVNAAARALRGAGLRLDEGSGWEGVTACTGAPGCQHAQDDTHALATHLAASAGRPDRIGLDDASEPMGAPRRLPVHVVACERRCGAPAGAHVELLARGGVLSVRRGGDGTQVARAGLLAAVDRARESQ